MQEAKRKLELRIQIKPLPQVWWSDDHLFLLETFCIKEDCDFTKQSERVPSEGCFSCHRSFCSVEDLCNRNWQMAIERVTQEKNPNHSQD